MPDHIDNLKHIVGESNAFDHQDDIHPFLEDWRGQVKGATPLILFPLGTEHVKNIVQYCNENNIKIVSQGGNTSLCGANVPNSSEQNIEIVINTSKMNKVIEVDPFNRSMIVESGCILQNIQSIAQDHDLLFPLSLSAEGSCQIGGNISTNAGGVNVVKYGMARDQVMGIEVVLPDGSIFSDLKSLRKNNTGYDLKQLFIGAEGTLGVITKVSLKLSSSPVSEITSMVSLNNIGDAISLLKHAKKKFLLNPSYFIKSNQNIKLHFDVFHGDGLIDKAINVLDETDRKDFKEFILNENSFNRENLFFCRSKKIMNDYFESIFNWLRKCEDIFGFNLNGYARTRIYAFLAERYLSYWFNKYTNALTWPIFFYDTNVNRVSIK